MWLQPQIEEGPERSLIWHRVSSNQFSMLYHHVQSTLLFPFQLIKIWKLQNDHESKRQDVMEDISFPKSLKILDKPPVCAVFFLLAHSFYLLHSHLSCSCVGWGWSLQWGLFQGSSISSLEESSICLVAEEAFSSEFGMIFEKLLLCHLWAPEPPFKSLNMSKSVHGPIWPGVKLNCTWEV